MSSSIISLVSVQNVLKKHWLTLVALLSICTLIYYFGELLDLLNWGGENQHFILFDQVHDIHRLLFLAPIIYACYFFSSKVTVIVCVASFLIFLPRAIFVSPFPDAIARSLIFITFAGVMCALLRIIRNKLYESTYDGAVIKGVSDDIIPLQSADEKYIVKDIEIDLSNRTVKKYGKDIKLTPKEYELLACLVHNSGNIMSHEDLLNIVWGQEYSQEREYLRNFIRQLRCKIEDDPSNPQIILTASHFGYRFLESNRAFNHHT